MPQKVSHLRENQNQHLCPRISSFLNKLILVILTFLHSDRYYYGCKEIAVKICRLTVAIGKNHVEITAFNNVSKSGIKESPAMSTVHAFIKDHNAMKHTRLMALCPGLPG